MATSSKLDAFRNRSVPAEITRYTKRNLDLVDRIAARLAELGWSQNELARRLGKRPSQVSKWMTGLQNMTLLTVAELEGVLETDLLAVVPATSASEERVTEYRAMQRDARGKVFRARRPSGTVARPATDALIYRQAA